MDRKKDAILPLELFEDADKLSKLISKEENGKVVGKYLATILSCGPNPRTQQSDSIVRYKQLVRSEMEKNKESLSRFKDKKAIVCIIVYLRKKRYEITDADNYTKPLVDGMKEYFGDDSIIQTVVVRKWMLDERYLKEDLDFLECSLILIADIKASESLLNF